MMEQSILLILSWYVIGWYTLYRSLQCLGSFTVQTTTKDIRGRTLYVYRSSLCNLRSTGPPRAQNDLIQGVIVSPGNIVEFLWSMRNRNTPFFWSIAEFVCTLHDTVSIWNIDDIVLSFLHDKDDIFLCFLWETDFMGDKTDLIFCSLFDENYFFLCLLGNINSHGKTGRMSLCFFDGSSLCSFGNIWRHWKDLFCCLISHSKGRRHLCIVPLCNCCCRSLSSY